MTSDRAVREAISQNYYPASFHSEYTSNQIRTSASNIQAELTRIINLMSYGAESATFRLYNLIESSIFPSFNKQGAFFFLYNENLGASYAECEAKYLELLPLVKTYHDQHPENDHARKALTALTQALNPERIPQERIVAEVTQTPVRPASPSSLSASSAMFSRPVAENVNEIEVTYTNKVPDEFCSPITYELMENPVIIIETEQVCDQKDAIKWFANHNTCPVSGTALESKAFVRNLPLKNLIEDWKKANKADVNVTAPENPK